MTTIEIIENLCASRGISTTQMLRNVGLSTGIMSQWKGGQKISNKSLKKIADYFGVSVDYLLGNPSNAEPADRSARTPVNFWGKVSAGIGKFIDGVPVRAMAADDEDMIDGYDYAWLEVEGDSMEDDLRDGDYVLVRVQSTAEPGDMVVVTITNEYNEDKGFVKWFEKEDSHIALISSNPKYPPRIFVGEAMNSVRIFGVVVTSKRKWK